MDSPDPSSRYGLRDRAMFHLAYAGGLRVSELVGLRVSDLALHPQATIHVMGKGRRERVLPLWKETATALRDWLKVRGETISTALFLNARGDAMTRSAMDWIHLLSRVGHHNETLAFIYVAKVGLTVEHSAFLLITAEPIGFWRKNPLEMRLG
jgi:site-specific recombinase XerD